MRFLCYQPKQKAEADNTNRDLDYSGYLIIVLLYIVLKKITTNAAITESRSHSYFAVRKLDIAVRELDIALGNHALYAQPTDYSLICRLRCFPELTVGF